MNVYGNAETVASLKSAIFPWQARFQVIGIAAIYVFPPISVFVLNGGLYTQHYHVELLVELDYTLLTKFEFTGKCYRKYFLYME
jgi:hypothetical protein